MGYEPEEMYEELLTEEEWEEKHSDEKELSWALTAFFIGGVWIMMLAAIFGVFTDTFMAIVVGSWLLGGLGLILKGKEKNND